jgi:WD40 repeat protein
MPLLAQYPDLTLQTGHSATISAIAFSNDGRILATSGDDNIIIVWDFRLGKQLKILKGHLGKVAFLRFIKHENRLISAGEDGRIFLWDIEKGLPVQRINLGMLITSADVDQTERVLAISGAFPDIKKYSIGDSLTFASTVKVWDEVSPEKITELIMKQKHLKVKRLGRSKSDLFEVFSNLFSPVPGTSCVSFGRDSSEMFFSRCLVLNAGTVMYASLDVRKTDGGGKVLHTYPAAVTGMCRDHSSSGIFFSALPSRVTRFDLQKNRSRYHRPGDLMKYNFTGVSVNSADSLFAAVNDDGKIYLWKMNGNFCRIYSNEENKYTSLCFHPQVSHLLVAGSANGDVTVIDVTEQKEIKKLQSGIYPLTCMAVNPSGNIIAVGSANNTVSYYSMNERISLEGYTAHKSRISGLHFVSDSLLVSSGEDNRISFYNVVSETSTLLKGNKNPAIISAIANAPFYSILLFTVSGYDFVRRFVRGSSESLDATSLSPDGKYFATGGRGFNNGIYYSLFAPRIFPVHVVNTTDMKKEYRFGAHYLSVDAIAFNKNARLITTCGSDYKSGSNINNEKALMQSAFSMLIPMVGLVMSAQKAFSISTLYNPYYSLKFWTTGSRNPHAVFELPDPVTYMQFYPENDSLLFCDSKKNIVLLDYKSKKTEKLAIGSPPLLFLDNEKNFLYQDSTFSMVAYKGSKLYSFSGHSDSVTAAAFTPGNKHLVTASVDGSLKIWETSSGKEIATVYAINTSDFIITTPDYYYYATRNAKKEIGFTFGTRFYPFEQYDLQYNRPDIVMERLGCASPEMIRALNLAYHKRLQKSGFSEEMFSSDFQLPVVEIANAAAIPLFTAESLLKIKVRAKDEKYLLDRINVWINDVALFGSNGYSLRGKQLHEFEEMISLNLSQGINRIRVSCMNEKGVESLRETAEITLTGTGGEKPDLHIIVIGASEYADRDWNLNYAAKDAQDVAEMFQQQKGNYGKINTTVLLNNEVTAVNIMRLRQQLMKTRVDDKVLVFYAGHGLLDENLDYYLATYQVNFKNPSDGGLSYDKLNSLLDSIPAREKILLIDACHSGELDKEETIMAETKEQSGIVFRGARPRGFQSGSEISYSNSFELMKEMFSDLRKGTGAMVISSAGGGEYAFEGSQWKNGVFTWSLREGLISGRADRNRDHVITVTELQQYVLEHVTKLTDGQQKPTMRQENVENDFVIWK